jgi:hypothetical protein
MEDNLIRLYRCEKHPKYGGKKQPKNGCVGCLNVYFAMHKTPRMPIKPTKIIKDKTKYSRKNKFNNKDN